MQPVQNVPSNQVSRSAVEHLPAISVVALSAMTVLAHLVPCDTAAAQWHNVAPVMLWILLLIGWALGLALRPQARLVFDKPTCAILVLTLLPGLSAAWIWWTESGNIRLAFNLAWQWASFGILFFLARQWLKSRADVRMLAAMQIAIATGLAAVALVQFSVLMPQTRLDFRNDPEKVIREAGLDPAADPAQLQHFKDRLNSKEPTATFALTNSLAGMLTPWLVLLCGLMGWGALSRHRNAWRLLIPAAMVAAALLLTKSRTAYLATAFGAGLALLLITPLGRRMDWRLIAGIGLAITVAIMGGVVIGVLDVDVLKDAPKSVLFRLQYWQATAQVIRRFPVLGSGPGNFQDTYKWYQLPEASENIADPHNFILETWTTAGTLGLLALCAAAVSVAWRIRTSSASDVSKEVPDHPTAPFFAHVLGAIGGVGLGYGCGFLAEVMPSLAVLYGGIPAAALSLWLLKPWIERGEISVSLLISALIALLINLLAAGGISFPGVSTSVWLLLAMALVVADLQNITSASADRLVPKWAAYGCLLAAVFAGVLYHRTVYDPVFRSTTTQSEATLAARSGRLNDAIASATSAAQRDPYSSQLWMSGDPNMVDLTDLWFTRVTSEGDTQALRSEFVLACAQATRLDPRSAGTQTQLGHRYLALFRQFGKQADLAAAQDYYAGAASRYPNNALVHAQLAWVMHLAGDIEQATVEAETALTLDRQHDHGEMKLAKLRIYDALPSPRQRDQPAPPDELTAEPIVERLRKASKP